MHELVIFSITMALLAHTASVYARMLAMREQYDSLQLYWQQAQLALTGNTTLLDQNIQIRQRTFTIDDTHFIEVQVGDEKHQCTLTQAVL